MREIKDSSLLQATRLLPLLMQLGKKGVILCSGITEMENK